MKKQMLTKEQERMLIIAAQQGDDKATADLCLLFRPLIQNVINKFSGNANLYGRSYIDVEDLIQQGYCGIIKAIKTFDLSLDLRFSTYAYSKIMNEVYPGIVEGNTFGIKRRTMTKVQMLLKKQMEEQRNIFSFEEVAEVTGLRNRKEIVNIIGAVQMITDTVSIDHFNGDESKVFLKATKTLRRMPL